MWKVQIMEMIGVLVLVDEFMSAIVNTTGKPFSSTKKNNMETHDNVSYSQNIRWFNAMTFIQEVIPTLDKVEVYQ